MNQSDLLSLLAELVMRARCNVTRSTVQRFSAYSKLHKEFSADKDYSQLLAKFIGKSCYGFSRFFGASKAQPGLTINVLLRNKLTGQAYLAEKFIFKLVKGSCSQVMSRKNLFHIIRSLLKRCFNCTVWNHFFGEQKRHKRLREFMLDCSYQGVKPCLESASLRTVLVSKRLCEKGVFLTFVEFDVSSLMRQEAQPPERKFSDDLTPSKEELSPKAKSVSSQEGKARRVSVYSYYSKEDDITFISTSQEDQGRAQHTVQYEEVFDFQFILEEKSADQINCSWLHDRAQQAQDRLALKTASDSGSLFFNLL